MHRGVTDAPQEARLDVRGLEIVRGGRTLLTGFTWTVGRGRPAWVVGGNGSGKTTLLRTLAGLDRPSFGQVTLRGSRRPLTRGYYHPSMDVPGDAALGRWRRFAPVLESDGPAARLWPAAPRRATRLAALSTGERKRLLLCYLLAARPEFLFLDEPFEHLSPDVAPILLTALVERARRGIVIVATNQPLPTGAARGAVVRLGTEEA